MGPSKEHPGARLSLIAPNNITGDRSGARLLDIAPHLAADDIAELRAAIERSLCDGEMRSSSQSEIDVDLHKALRVACAKARLQRVRAEQLIVDLKQVWMMLPTMLSTRTEQRLNRIVSTCIDEYYACEESPQR
jgi:hypothetical protein